MKKLVFIFLILIHFAFIQKEYKKTYYKNGNLKEEGWILKSQKTDYWFYYYENGNKKSEGHYANNEKNKWWIFYNENGQINKKSEYKNNNLDGLVIIYKNGKISCAEKYEEGKKIKTWHSISAFKKDNPIIR